MTLMITHSHMTFLLDLLRKLRKNSFRKKTIRKSVIIRKDILSKKIHHHPLPSSN